MLTPIEQAEGDVMFILTFRKQSCILLLLHNQWQADQKENKRFTVACTAVAIGIHTAMRVY